MHSALSRRDALGALVASGIAVPPLPLSAADDPIFAAINEHRRSWAVYDVLSDESEHRELSWHRREAEMVERHGDLAVTLLARTPHMTNAELKRATGAALATHREAERQLYTVVTANTVAGAAAFLRYALDHECPDRCAFEHGEFGTAIAVSAERSLHLLAQA